jgi:hypothetical protein
MTFLPRRRYLRIAAAIWLAAALVVLVAMLLRPELRADERSALSSLVPLYFMSFPLGHVGLEAIIRLRVELYVASGFVPGIFPEGVWLWALLTVAGYLQWFALLPMITTGIRRLVRAYTARDAAAGKWSERTF